MTINWDEVFAAGRKDTIGTLPRNYPSSGKRRYNADPAGQLRGIGVKPYAEGDYRFKGTIYNDKTDGPEPWDRDVPDSWPLVKAGALRLPGMGGRGWSII